MKGDCCFVEWYKWKEKITQKQEEEKKECK